jgi:lysyl-tRNA synthetase class 2
LNGISRKKSVLTFRSKLIQSIRDFFKENGYLEVETPYLIPAPIPEAHIDSFKADQYYLHSSPEICMKRLLSAGYEKIFQICRVFRMYERGRYHLPEFTLLEWYKKGVDYNEIMKECQKLILFINERLNKQKQIMFQGNIINIDIPWKKISLKDLFQQYASMSLKEAVERSCFDIILLNEIEPILPKHIPVFITDYPREFSPLARVKRNDPYYAERFELYMGGLEIANGSTELNDPVEQKMRLEMENKKRINSGKEPYSLPENFLNDMVSMPPSSGIALGIDRLVMIFSNSPRIDHVVSFTHEEL